MITIYDSDDVIYMFPEVPSDEVLRSAEIRPKRENSDTGIERLVMLFDGSTYKSGKQLFMTYK